MTSWWFHALAVVDTRKNCTVGLLIFRALSPKTGTVCIACCKNYFWLNISWVKSLERGLLLLRPHMGKGGMPMGWPVKAQSPSLRQNLTPNREKERFSRLPPPCSIKNTRNMVSFPTFYVFVRFFFAKLLVAEELFLPPPYRALRFKKNSPPP